MHLCSFAVLKHFLFRSGKKNEVESVSDVDEPREKRSRIEGTDSIQENAEVDKENVLPLLVKQTISSKVSTPSSIIRPQAQVIA